MYPWPRTKKDREESERWKDVSENDKTQRMTFTEEESKLIERTFENRYDLKNDERHNTWLKSRMKEGRRLCHMGR